MQKKHPSSVVKNLLWVDLPLTEEAPAQRTLVLALGLARQRTRILLCDLDGNIVQRTIIGENLPEEYNPSFLDKLDSYFAEHDELLAKIVLEGAAKHGPLTLARAIHFSSEEGLDAAAGLAKAVDVSAKCRDYYLRLLEVAAPAFETPSQ